MHSIHPCDVRFGLMCDCRLPVAGARSHQLLENEEAVRGRNRGAAKADRSEQEVASGNSWSNVLVMTTEEEAKTNLSSFINCLFIGENVISSQEGEVHFGDDICLPSCVSTTTFKNCVLFPNCFFSNNTLVENCIFLSGSVCMSNGRITCKGRFCFPF